MAADNELRVLNRAISEGTLAPLLERNILAEWFLDDDARTVFLYLKTFQDKYGKLPTLVTVADQFPSFRLLDVKDPLEYLADQMVDFQRRKGAILAVQDAAELISNTGDHEAAIRRLASVEAGLPQGVLNTITEIDLADDPMSRWREYLHRKSTGNGMLGLPTGFPTIDDATAGLQPEQLVTIIAPPKAGKSVLAMQIAIVCHAAGKSPFFQSFEMSNKEQAYRHDAFRAGVSHSRLIRSQLEPAEEVRYKRLQSGMLTAHPFYLADSLSGTTVSAIEARVTALNPDLVVIDGCYLILDEVTGEMNTPQSLTNITRSLKKMAQRIKKPVIITTQALLWKMKGNKVGADSIGYSSSFFQDSDVLLGLQRSDDDDDQVRLLRVLPSRQCGPAEADLVWDWNTGTFEEFSARP